MTRRHATIAPAAALLLSVFLLAPPTAADDPPPPPDEKWHDTAEFSFVATAGNAETQTLGLKNKLWRAWGASAFELNAGAVRAEAERVTRFALGTPASFSVQEDSESEVTAEAYFLNGRYDYKVSSRFFWFAGGGWDRNRPAGIQNRYVALAGIGNTWADREDLKFRTDYAFTWTSQDDVVKDPAFDTKFTGLRVSWSYLDKFGAATTFTHDTILDQNLEEGDDFRGNMINAIAVAMNSRLALKVSLQWLYDRSPALTAVPLFDTAAPPPAGAPTGTVLVELDELDTVLTSSLVVNF